VTEQATLTLSPIPDASDPVRSRLDAGVASMTFDSPVPLFIVRWMVRRNPWLLSDHGSVARRSGLIIGPAAVDIETEMALRPAHKRKLQAEADAGTLFLDRHSH